MEDLSIIRNRFFNSTRVNGNNDEITTPSGVKIKGRYILTESGSVTPSHDPLNGFCKSEGFPIDEYGQTVNDRDYERDLDAQKITRQIAENYDSRALSSPVVVSKDGIVLSGNGRTMAGMLAAQNGTDSAYIGYLVLYYQKYGFTTDDVLKFKHPRILFLVDDDYPYNAETFAMFNAQEIKSQSKTELAVKLGKLVDDETFARILRNINTFDTISEFYADTKSASEAIGELVSVGVISKMQYPEMFDGDSISQSAREILENVLIGKAFQKNNDAVRQITAFKGVRRNIINALAEISNNISLGDYSLESEMSEAIFLCYQARANGCFHQGDVVSGFARQMTLFGGYTLADYNNKVIMLLADTINHTQVTRLKKLFAVYNHNAADAASGQTDMFSDGGVKSRKEILDEVVSLFDEKKDLDKAVSDAATQRKQDAKDSISFEQTLKENAETFDFEVQKETLGGLRVGTIVGLNLPCGDTIGVKLERICNGQVGVRLLGWVRIIVSEELIAPTDKIRLSLPDWLYVGTRLSNGLEIISICKTGVILSDGKTYSFKDVLFCCSPEMKSVA